MRDADRFEDAECRAVRFADLRADVFAEHRAVVRADVRADAFTDTRAEKAPMNILSQAFIQELFAEAIAVIRKGNYKVIATSRDSDAEETAKNQVPSLF